tara:strand:- start:120 stop:815 length:696 start_codon:yes stop_codon:yes gene_type:complete
MPCYGDMKVETCISLLDTFSTLGKNGIECKFKSVKSSLVTHGRNLSTCGFLHSEMDYMLFVDADLEFNAETVLRMLVPAKDIVCTPYRLKNKPGVADYSVNYPDPEAIKVLPWDLVEITEGPAGLMLISRKVFDKLMEKYPELKCEYPDELRSKMNAQIGTETDAVNKYFYNFWDTSFKNHTWKGEDIAFCNLATDAGFKIYANLDSWTTHHGSWGFKGKFGDSLIKKPKN